MNANIKKIFNIGYVVASVLATASTTYGTNVVSENGCVTEMMHERYTIRLLGCPANVTLRQGPEECPHVRFAQFSVILQGDDDIDLSTDQNCDTYALPCRDHKLMMRIFPEGLVVEITARMSHGREESNGGRRWWVVNEKNPIIIHP
jgi:hypothetical protein